MKSNLLILLTVIIIAISGCDNGNGNGNSNGNDNNHNKEHTTISADFLDPNSLSRITHVDNIKAQNKDIQLIFNQDELKLLPPQLSVTIVPEIIAGADKVTIMPLTLNTKVEDLINNQLEFKLKPEGSKGGEVKIRFIINQVAQNSQLQFMLSCRKIVDIVPDHKIYQVGALGKAKIKAVSDAVNDRFTVSFTGSNINKNQLTPSCLLSNFSNNTASCDIEFAVADAAAEITATIEDEQQQHYRQSINSCAIGANTLSFDIVKPAAVGYNQDLNLVVNRCSNNLSSLTARIIFGENDAAVSTIVGVKNSVNNNFNFEDGQTETTIVISRKNDKVSLDDFRYNLPATLALQATATNYSSSEIMEIDNADTDSPRIKLQGDMEIAQGSIQTVIFTRDNILDTKINFCLAKDINSKECDNDLANKYSLSEISKGKLQLDLSSQYKLAAGKYYLLAFLANTSKTAVAITGHARTVTVKPADKLQFVMQPSLKHVLIDFPSFYYLGIRDGDNQAAVIGDKLYLYSLAASAANCAKVEIEAVDIKNPAAKGSICTLGSQDQVGSCSCPLTDGKLNQTCIFKIIMPNGYLDQDQCQFSLRTERNFNEGVAIAKATVGLPDINIKIASDNDMFATNWLEMYNDGAGHSLNQHWVTAITVDNINNNKLFDDNALFEMQSNYFKLYNNSFIIKNYPGKNNSGGSVSLPQIYFIAGWGGIWNSNRCEGYDEDFPSALGCSSGGWPAYWGAASIPAGAIKVDSQGLTSVSGDINVSNGWQYGVDKNRPKLAARNLSKIDAGTVQINIPIQNAGNRH